MAAVTAGVPEDVGLVAEHGHAHQEPDRKEDALARRDVRNGEQVGSGGRGERLDDGVRAPHEQDGSRDQAGVAGDATEPEQVVSDHYEGEDRAEQLQVGEAEQATEQLCQEHRLEPVPPHTGHGEQQ